MKRDLALVRWLTFAALLAVAGVFLLPGLQRGDALVLPRLILIIVAAWLLTWALELWLALMLRRTGALAATQPGPDETQHFGALYNQLLQATYPHQVLESIMQAACESLKALGCSFVPYDEWGQSLPAVTHGYVPAAERLSMPDTRQACKTCKALGSAADCVLLRDAERPAGAVRCLTLRDDTRELGVFNFYFESRSTALTELESARLAQLMQLAATALRSISMRAQDINSLRPVSGQFGENLSAITLLEELLSNLRKTIAMDVASFWIPGGIISASQQASFLSTQPQGDRGPAAALSEMRMLADLWETIQRTRQPILQADASASGQAVCTASAFPLAWNDEAPLGLLWVKTANEIDAGQQAVLKLVAREAALIVLNTRLMAEAEYRAVLDERARLAREIHDGLAQTLAFLKMQSDQMQLYLAQGRLDRLGEMLKASSRTLNDAYLDARQAIDNLRRVPDLGLDEMLKHMAAEFTAAMNLPVNTNAIAPVKDITLNVRAQLLRVVQEALANIRKHARAKNVEIALRMVKGELILEVHDDGQGFASELVTAPTQYGLRGMRERAEMIGAEFQVISRPGAGTTVRVQIPVKIEETS